LQILDKQSPVPLYYQLYSILLKDINESVYKTGDALPTEVELMETYGISRATVRQAIIMLVNKGYLERKKSKGTFVKEYEQNVIYKGRIRGFTAETKERQIPLRSIVLDKKIIPASGALCGNLKIAEGGLVFYIKRLRLINDEPNTLVEDYVPYYLCPDIEKIDFVNDSLYETLENIYRIIPHHARRIFESFRPSKKDDITALEIPPNSSILFVESFVYLQDNTPLEYYNALVKGKYIVDV
jgi:GntR family transcriptional regulator